MAVKTMEDAKPRLMGAALAVLIAVLVGLFAFAPAAQAEEESDVTTGGYSFHLWAGPDGASVALNSYSGNGTQISLPTSIKAANGTIYSAAKGNGYFFVNDEAFKGNTTVKAVGVSEGYEYVGSGAFAGCISLGKVSFGNSVTNIGSNVFDGCASLKEVVIGSGVNYIGEDAFAGCTNLKTYRIAGTDLSASSLGSSGIGVDKDGNVIEGVTVYTKKGSPVDDYVKSLNEKSTNGKKITLVYEDDPYSGHEVKGTSLPLTVDPDEDPAQMGNDGTPLGEGATEAAATAALEKYSKETDPKGAKFGLLKAKVSKVTKTSVTVKWSKVKGAKKYIVYGNTCGKKHKLAKQKALKAKTTSTMSCTFKKVAKAAVKKGTYYKFGVVALDKNNKVISTSKIVHAATPGGKFCNEKKVTTAAKKGAKTIKVKKTFNLKAKSVKANSKLKMAKHRGISYESSNPKIATVSKTGVITGKRKGSCYVFAYAQNGVCANIKVTVK